MAGHKSECCIDLTEKIKPWLYRCIVLSDSLGLYEIGSELRELNTYWRTPIFRLAIIGELNRGKSTLINRLLARHILPVGRTRTTATLISVIAGSEELMEVNFADGNQELRPLQQASWRDLLATSLANSEQTETPIVRVTVNQSWLQTLDIELIDTPATDELKSERTAKVFQLLSQCDAALLLVSANSPFSMTERDFLKEKIMESHVPRVLVLVSHLDIFALEERESLLANIRQRVETIAPYIPVLPLHPVNNYQTESEIIDTVRSQIEALVNKGNHRTWRSGQLARQLLDYLDKLMEISEAKLAAIHLSPTEKEQMSQQIKIESIKAEHLWESLRLELERKYWQHNTELRQRIPKTQQDIREILSMELNKAEEPKFWWEKELPLHLRKELSKVSNKWEELWRKALIKDLAWLQCKVENAFGIQINQISSEHQVPSQKNLNLNQLSLAEMRLFRLLKEFSKFTVFGSSFKTAAEVFVFGGIIAVNFPAIIIIATSLGTAIVSEEFFRQKLEKQRQLISQEMERSINRAIDDCYRYISNYFRKFYDMAIEDTKREQSVWQSTINRNLEPNQIKNETELWQDILDRVTILRQEIIISYYQ